MRWTSPPERRELVLILFSVTCYLLAYNIETSLNYVGIDPVAAQGALFRRIGLGKTKVLGRDGRKPAGWRDRLELSIFGAWNWDEGHVAGDAATRDQLKKGGGRHGAQWMDKRVARALDTKRFGDNTVNGGHVWWYEDLPTTNVVKHVPGYTILDNVIIHKGSVYLVSDDKARLPPLASIIESGGGWQTLDREQASTRLGEYGGIIKGVTWMSMSPPSNTTLFDLWRMYSTLDPHIDAQGHTTLTPPQRIVFPRIPFFKDLDPEEPPADFHLKPRPRSETGLHPKIIKSAFPFTDVQYQQDWEDYHKMEVPFVIERLVVADRAAAVRSLNKGQPANTPPFDLEASRFWWEPVRRTLVSYFDRLDEELKALAPSDTGSFWSWKPKSKKVVVFIDNQAEAVKGGKSAILPEDHDYFSRSLNKLGRDKGYEVHTLTPDTPWEARMDVMIRSTIVVGNHGDHLFDAMWMRPSPQATLMEFFPENTFTREREIIARSLGLKYIAWWTNRHFTKDALPEVVVGDNQPVHINTDAIIKEIHEVLSAKHR